MLTSPGNTTALAELDDIAGRPVVDREMVFRDQPFRIDGSDQSQFRRAELVS